MAKTPSRAPVRPRSELGEALDACRSTFWAIALFSGMSNILMLTGSIFMLEVYDRVLPSRSVSTLVALLVLAAGLYGGARHSRPDPRPHHGADRQFSLDEAVSERVYDAIVRLPLIIGNRGDGIQPLRDLDAVRSFLSGLGPIAFFDLPWIPFYLAICFAFHPYIGLTALVGAVRAGRAHACDRDDDAAARQGRGRPSRATAACSRKRAGAMPRRSSPWG